ncbi:MAG: Gfo/Idh/MocA family oxidoreductase, partial [Bacteroidota bacterium]
IEAIKSGRVGYFGIDVYERGEKAADYAKRHGVARWYDNADALIADPEVNAVYVATPPGSHLEYALKVAEAGKPCYVEKPMARTFEECQKMVSAFVEKDLPLYVAYYRRRLPLFEKVKELLAEEAVGEVRYVNLQLQQAPKSSDLSGEANWRVDPSIAGGGYFFDLASHQLDLLDYLLGPINEVHGISTNQAGLYQAEDAVVAAFEFASGAVATGNWNFSVAPEASQDLLEIVGNTGKIRFSTFADHPLELITSAGHQHWNFQNPEHIQSGLLETVIADLRGTGECPSTGRSAARTNWVMGEMVQEEEE